MLSGKQVVIVNCFDTYGARVDLLVRYFQENNATTQVITSDYRHFLKCKNTENKPDYTYLPVKPYRRNLSIERLLSHRSFAKDVFSCLDSQEQTPDLVWVLLPPNSLAKEAAAYKKRHQTCKLVFDIIDLWPETMPIPLGKKLPPFANWQKLRDRWLPYAETVVTECNLYQSFLKKLSIPVQTIYLARERTPKPPRNPKSEKLCLAYLGSINNIIDIELMTDLIRSQSRYQPVELHIIGDGEKREALLKSCKAAGAEVIYHGTVFDREEKWQIFGQCHYGLNTMKSTVAVGLTMKSMDYFEAGLPILNSIPGDTWEIVEKYGVGYNLGLQEKQKKAQKLNLQENLLEIYQQSFAQCNQPKSAQSGEQHFAQAGEQNFTQSGEQNSTQPHAENPVHQFFLENLTLDSFYNRMEEVCGKLCL